MRDYEIDHRTGLNTLRRDVTKMALATHGKLLANDWPQAVDNSFRNTVCRIPPLR